MKTKEELNVLKEEVETLNKKLAELTEDELKAVTGGSIVPCVPPLEHSEDELKQINGLIPPLPRADNPFIIDSVTDLEKLANIVGE